MKEEPERAYASSKIFFRTGRLVRGPALWRVGGTALLVVTTSLLTEPGRKAVKTFLQLFLYLLQALSALSADASVENAGLGHLDGPGFPDVLSSHDCLSPANYLTFSCLRSQ